MRSNLLTSVIFLSSLGIATAAAQTNPPANRTTPTGPAATTTTAPVDHGGMWRSSKLIGVNVYNDQSEKLGDINEILLDKTGKVAGVVIGVGGFLGMGEHDIMVQMDKLKFVNEPVRTSTSSTTTTTGAGHPATTTTTTKDANDHKWYPDHAVLSGASKDQLKSMPQFKYN